MLFGKKQANTAKEQGLTKHQNVDGMGQNKAKTSEMRFWKPGFCTAWQEVVRMAQSRFSINHPTPDKAKKRNPSPQAADNKAKNATLQHKSLTTRRKRNPSP